MMADEGLDEHFLGRVDGCFKVIKVILRGFLIVFSRDAGWWIQEETDGRGRWI
jgi:hypothetical protein